MNVRQKRKLFAENLIKIKKLHPKEGDVICIIPDFDAFSLDEMAKFMDVCCNCNICGKANLVLVPGDIKSLSKEEYQKILKINEQTIK